MSEELLALVRWMAEQECSRPSESTKAGMARARERHGGALPPRGRSITGEQIARAVELARTTDLDAAAIAEAVGISRATLYRHVDVAGLRSAAA